MLFSTLFLTEKLLTFPISIVLGICSTVVQQDKTSSSFPPEMEKISLSRFFWGVGGGAGGRAGFGKELMVWNCI